MDEESHIRKLKQQITDIQHINNLLQKSYDTQTEIITQLTKENKRLTDITLMQTELLKGIQKVNVMQEDIPFCPPEQKPDKDHIYFPRETYIAQRKIILDAILTLDTSTLNRYTNAILCHGRYHGISTQIKDIWNTSIFFHMQTENLENKDCTIADIYWDITSSPFEMSYWNGNKYIKFGKEQCELLHNHFTQIILVNCPILDIILKKDNMYHAKFGPIRQPNIQWLSNMNWLLMDNGIVKLTAIFAILYNRNKLAIKFCTQLAQLFHFDAEIYESVDSDEYRLVLTKSKTPQQIMDGGDAYYDKYLKYKLKYLQNK